MEQILITQTSTDKDGNIQIYFTILSTLLQGQVTLTQDDYIKAIQTNGFDGVKQAILDNVKAKLASL